jgi:hypothetical protein
MQGMQSGLSNISLSFSNHLMYHMGGNYSKCRVTNVVIQFRDFDVMIESLLETF